MSFLFKLPEVIISDILEDFSKLKEIVLLDSAVLNFKERSAFLKVIQREEFSHSQPLKISNLSVYIWVCSRSLKLENVTFQNIFHLANLPKSNPLNISDLFCLEFHINNITDVDFIIELLGRGSELSSLKLISKFGIFPPIIFPSDILQMNCCNNLQTLHLTDIILDEKLILSLTGKINNMKDLFLNFDDKVTDEKLVIELLGQSPLLETIVLTIDKSIPISNILLTLFTNCKNLKDCELNCNTSQIISSDALLIILINNNKLVRLTLDPNTNNHRNEASFYYSIRNDQKSVSLTYLTTNETILVEMLTLCVNFNSICFNIHDQLTPLVLKTLAKYSPEINIVSFCDYHAPYKRDELIEMFKNAL
jgi:hypothetical protein